MDFLDNILNGIDNPSYKITLKMISERDMQMGEYINPESYVIIAKSGETSKISIDDLEVISNPSPDKNNQNAETRKYTFTISEYYGSNFMDLIYDASMDLGIKSYISCPYILEVVFTGRNVDSSEPISEIDNLRWVWPISIRSISADMATSGTVYRVESYGFGQTAEKVELGTIEQTIEFSANTVPDALEKLFAEINKQATHKALSNAILPNIYEIDIHKDIRSLRLIERDRHTEVTDSQVTTNIPSGITQVVPNASYKGDHINWKTIRILKGTPIHTAIKNIVIAGEEHQAWLENRYGRIDNTQQMGINVLHKIETEVTIGSFNYVSGDYQKKIKYEVMPYIMTSLTGSPSDVSGVDGTDRYNEIKNSGLIAKRYDYMYTGLNDKVLDFEMKFDLAWQVHLPTHAGNGIQYSDVSHGQFITNKYRKMMKVQQDIVNMNKDTPTEQDDGTSKPLTQSEIQANIDSIDELTEEEKESLEQLLDFAVTKWTSPFMKLSERKAPTNRYLEDYSDYRNDNAMSYRVSPMRYVETTRLDSFSDEYGIEPPKGPIRPQINALYQQAFSHQSNAFVTGELKIKGDPYWLQTTKSGLAGDESVDSNIGQPCILFTVQQPEMWGDDGITRFKASNFSGLFIVREITSSFTGGKFTQTLVINRNPFVDVGDIEDLTEEVSEDTSESDMDSTTEENETWEDLYKQANINASTGTGI